MMPVSWSLNEVANCLLIMLAFHWVESAFLPPPFFLWGLESWDSGFRLSSSTLLALWPWASLLTFMILNLLVSLKGAETLFWRAIVEIRDHLLWKLFLYMVAMQIAFRWWHKIRELAHGLTTAPVSIQTGCGITAHGCRAHLHTKLWFFSHQLPWVCFCDSASIFFLQYWLLKSPHPPNQ